MAIYGKHLPMKMAEDPSDPVWRWFILNGPHGERFEWLRFGNLKRDIEYLEEFIKERTALDADFREKARLVSLKALNSTNSIMIRTAIQLLTILATKEDMELIKEHVNSDDEAIAKDAKSCLFERGIKVKKQKLN